MKRRNVVIAFAFVGIVAALVVAIALLRRDPTGSSVVTASGTVESTEADLGFQTGGRVHQVLVREGDAVIAGQVLATLDVAELEARRAAAEAQVRSARALLDELRRGSRAPERRQADAAVAAARARMDEAARAAERARTLFEGGAISREDNDRAETALRVARAQYEQAQQGSAIVDEGPRTERIAAQAAMVEQAEAAVAQVTANLEQAVVHAPFAGIVTQNHREPGETVAPGLPVVTIMNAADRWVRIYVSATSIGSVHVGQSATITGDTYPDRSYDGRVTFIASESEFTPRNVQTTEERAKLVYAVKVAVTGDPRGELKTGVPADVRIDTRARPTSR